jgi:adenylate kinase family enzyme
LGREVILIGPMGAGKSTQGKLLAAALGLPQCSMDEVRWDYYREIGFDDERQREIGEKKGFAEIYRYWKPFEADAV